MIHYKHNKLKKNITLGKSEQMHEQNYKAQLCSLVKFKHIRSTLEKQQTIRRSLDTGP